MGTTRKYPVGVQSFEEIRKGGYLYIDKTALIYELVQQKYYFINRPRRFGKSLLISTLAAYFEGRRELFQGLAIDALEKEWRQYPVLRFDFSTGKHEKPESLADDIHTKLLEYEQKYGLDQAQFTVNVRMRLLIRRVYEQTGRQVVLLIDEYDSAMMLNADRPEVQQQVRSQMRNLFAPIKEADPMLRFVLFTGITKFSQMSVFSELNNLTNISMLPKYEALCGITEEELTTQMRPDIEQLAEMRGQTPKQAHADLKALYDGYHFSHRLTDVYNPYSLLSALSTGELVSFWFATATPTSLIRILRKRNRELPELEGITLDATAFDRPVEGDVEDPIPIIYQSGYLTIKGATYIANRYRYTLGFPNSEVRSGFADCLIDYINGAGNFNKSHIGNAYFDLYQDDDIGAFIEALKVFFAAYPYDITNHNERHYQSVLYTLLVAFGADVRAEQTTNRGRIDIVLKMPKTIYVIEMKYDGTADEALAQIRERGYAEGFSSDPRRVCLAGMSFSSTERNITEWKCESIK